MAASLRKLYKPNFGWVEGDKEYDIAEVRLRFELDASYDPGAVLVAVAGQIDKAIQFQERLKDFHVISRVPSKRRMKGKKPCCLQMAQPAGTELKLVIQPSEFQGDTDDAQNFGEMSDKAKRIHVDGKVDWVVITHMWVPMHYRNIDQEKEETAGNEHGLATWDQIPAEYWPHIRKKLQEKNNE